MLIAVMSDSHDNIWRMEEAVSLLHGRGAEMVIHCGDMVAPFMLFELEKARAPVHAVFGNNDGDHFLLMKTAAGLTDITYHGLWGRVEAGGASIAFTHYREVADGLAASGQYQLVCYGHTHEHVLEKCGAAWMLNPGEIMGMGGASGFCLVDTDSWACEQVFL